MAERSSQSVGMAWAAVGQWSLLSGNVLTKAL
jgi:hypothetical protein